MNKFLIGFAGMMLCFSAQAEIKVSDAWVRTTAPGQPVAAAYMQLTSDSDVDLVGASSDVAGSVEIHEMSMAGEVMKMRQVKVLPLKAGKAVELAPGGYHLMLLDLHHQIKEGEIVPIALMIKDKAGKQNTIYLKLSARAAK